MMLKPKLLKVKNCWRCLYCELEEEAKCIKYNYMFDMENDEESDYTCRDWTKTPAKGVRKSKTCLCCKNYNADQGNQPFCKLKGLKYSNDELHPDDVFCEQWEMKK